MQSLVETFIAALAPNGRVADVGAGDGRHSKRMVEAGLRVAAVDRKAPAEAPAGVEWVTADIKEWIESLSEAWFDGFLLKNVMQFFPHDLVMGELLPRLAAALRPGGVIAIETFTRPPVPDFAKSHSSFYSADELEAAFPSWIIVEKHEMERDGRDLQGERHLFFIAGLIVKKKPA